MTIRTGKREAKRLARLYKDRQIVADLRKHFTGYEAKDGISTSVNKIAELPYSKRRSLRKKHEKLQALLNKPFIDFVKPADPIARKALRQFTGEKMRGMKHFIVQKPFRESEVRVVEGNVQIRSKHLQEGGGEATVTERYYMFPSVARSHSHMLKMFDRMYPKMPAKGLFVLQTDTYGDTGGIVQRELLREELTRLLEVYDRPKYGENRFMFRIAGFRWMGQSIKGAAAQKSKLDEARQAQREFNYNKSEKLKAEIAAAKKKANRCPVVYRGKRCKKKVAHKGEHRF